MYPLTPLKAELIPLAKHTEGLGNEEVDYKLSLSLFSESVEQNTLDTKTTTSNVRQIWAQVTQAQYLCHVRVSNNMSKYRENMGRSLGLEIC